MNADIGVGVTDAGDMGLPNGFTKTDKPDEKHGFIVPAGAMIGLGLGFLVGQPGSGVMIGVGLGLLAAELIALVTRSREGAGWRREGTNVTVLLIGAFLVFIGAGLFLAPALLWPYAVPGFLILLGIVSLVRGFFRSG